MNPIPRILAKVTREPWAIIPEHLHSIVGLLERHNSGMESAIKPMDSERPVGEYGSGLMGDVGGGTAVYRIQGIIGQHLSSMETWCGGTDIAAVVGDLEKLAQDSSVKRILLYFDSPGGTVVGLPEAAERLREIDRKKPVVSFTDSLMASAAYWFASQTSKIIATPSSNVGSIGVYSLFLDQSEAMRKAGIKVNAVSAGEFKLAGASFKPMSDDERGMFQAEVDKIYGQFKEAATSRRKIEDRHMQGQVFDGEEAMDFGLVDDLVLSLGDAIQFAAQLTPKP